MTIKDRLKSLRRANGLTLDDVAKKVGVSRQTIQRYESGVISNIPSDNIEKLALALNTTPMEIMGWNTAGNIQATTNTSFDDKSPLHALTQAYLRRPQPVQEEILRRLSCLDTTFSRKVSKLLQASGKIDDFMEKTGLPFVIVGKLMQGETVQTTPDEAQKIANYFNADVIDLFFGSTEVEATKTVSKTEAQLPEPITNLFNRELDEESDISPAVRLLIESLEEYLKDGDIEPYYKDVEDAVNTVKYTDFDFTLRETLKKYNGDLNPKVVTMIAAKELYKSPFAFDVSYIHNNYAVENFIKLIDSALKLSRQ